jgi:hypothetical protein
MYLKFKINCQPNLTNDFIFRVLPVLLTFSFTDNADSAQQGQITGTVKDAKGSPVASNGGCQGSPTSAITGETDLYYHARWRRTRFSSVSFESG